MPLLTRGRVRPQRRRQRQVVYRGLGLLLLSNMEWVLAGALLITGVVVVLI
jgi:hypothetical protein